ncbi:MAG: carbonic anhydrase family protein [Pseudomonadota bacterium]
MPALPPALSIAAACAAALLSLSAAASEHPPAAPAPGKGKVVAEAAHDAPAKEAAVKDAPFKKTPKIVEALRDPLDVLRERLAQKLGARTADTASPNVVRVVSKAGASLAVGSHENAAAHATEPKRPVARRAADHHAAHWDYTGQGGPETWGRMKPEFSKCSTGTRQSPIDIRDGIRVELDPVRFDYKPSGFRVVDNGHTVQVNVAPGNSIEVMGRRYELVQFHFHRPSEERIDGKQFDMVVHLVHKDLDGRLAVVAVLLDRGAAQPLIQSVWNNLPLEKGDEVAARLPINLDDLLPPQRQYFTYMGSLTTPPCSEGVLWMVMKQPVPVSPEQIGIFARLYPMNARPIQSASGRLIKESN